jgi:alcohol dehydrogenase class IV
VSDEEAGEAVASAISEFTKKMGVPQRLRDAGVPESGLAEAAEVTMGMGGIVYNPKMVSDPEEILGVFKQAW